MERPRAKTSRPARPQTLIEFDPDIRQALELLGRDRRKTSRNLPTRRSAILSSQAGQR